ncbi:MAG: tetratricopeptide repeat protein [Elusimicrobiota bacterium]
MKKILVLILMSLAVFTGGVYSADSGYRDSLKKGLELFNDGKSGQAEEIFKELAAKYPERPETYSSLGLLQISAGEYEAAKEYLKESIKKDRNYAHGYYLLGRVQEELENYSSALKNYNKYLKLETDIRPENRKREIEKKIDFLEEITGSE